MTGWLSKSESARVRSAPDRTAVTLAAVTWLAWESHVVRTSRFSADVAFTRRMKSQGELRCASGAGPVAVPSPGNFMKYWRATSNEAISREPPSFPLARRCWRSEYRITFVGTRESISSKRGVAEKSSRPVSVSHVTRGSITCLNFVNGPSFPSKRREKAGPVRETPVDSASRL